MEPRIVNRGQIILVGFSFCGDPFAESGDWTEQNQIGRLWSRFITYLTDHRHRIRHVVNDAVAYEVHVESEEAASKGHREVFVGVVLLLLAVIAAYLDGLLVRPIHIGYRYLLLAPALVPYLLLTQPPLRRLREHAVSAFRPLVPVDSAHYHRTLGRAPMFNRRREWLALGVGAIAGPLLTRPAWPLFPFWTKAYVILAGAVLFGLLGWFIYSSLSGTRLFSEANTRAQGVNVFELAFLEPIGRWSLGVALSYIGGSSLSLIFLPRAAMITGTAIICTVLLLAPVPVFFLNMLGARRIVVAAKRRELRMVRDGLAAASEALKGEAAQGDPEEMSSLLGQFSAWVAVEQRVKQVPEWPYTAGIRRGLALSLLLPVVVGVMQGLLAEAILGLVR